MTLMKSAPPASNSRTRWRTSASLAATPRRISSGHDRALGQARDFAAAAGDGHVGAGDEHARPFDLAGIDGVTQRDVHERAVGADVAHRREAGIERRARVRDAHQRVACRGTRERRRDVRGADVADEVRVQVDEAGQHGVRRPVDQPAAGPRTRGPGRDRRDAPVLDADRAIREVHALLDVEHAPDPHDDRFRARGREPCRARECERCKQRRANDFHSGRSPRDSLIINC